MNIGPDYAITTDKFNWILTHWIDGTDKAGNPKRHARQTFYATLQQACAVIVQREAAAAPADAQAVIAAIAAATQQIETATAGITREAIA